MTRAVRWRWTGRATSWSRATRTLQTFPPPPARTTPTAEALVSETMMSLSLSWRLAATRSSTAPSWGEIAVTRALRWRWTRRATSWSRAARTLKTFPPPPALTTPASTEGSMSLSSGWRPAATCSSTVPLWGDFPRTGATRWRWMARTTSWSRARRNPQAFPPPPGPLIPARTETRMSLSSSWRPTAPAAAASSTAPLWGERSRTMATQWRWTRRATSWSRALRGPCPFPPPPGLTTPATTLRGRSLFSRWRWRVNRIQPTPSPAG